MIERTEELGLAARLTISVGGQPVHLRTLNLEESEEWQAQLAAKVADFDLPNQANPEAVLVAFAKQPTTVMLALVNAYDVDDRLPPNLRKLFTQAELYAAIKQMVRAEAPFLEDARSMAEAYGPQLRMLVSNVLFNLYQQASSTSGALPTGDSTPESSADDSPRNDSSSSGPMVNGASNGRHRSKASSPKSPAPTPTSTPQ